MRDIRFVAVHRGGELTIENHRKMMEWAIACFSRVLHMYYKELDEPLSEAIKVANDWKNGKCSTGAAINESRAVHAFARTINNPISCLIARAIGHGVATAHMADHCMGAALYAQKALKLAGKPYEQEKSWQIEKLEDLLPDNLAQLIKETMEAKAKGLGI